ncbi:blue copper protein [Vigna radiata var. radiata]|uniref:Blue copper protein n=1 Tax=Vigna radiata var. radiata TaxID=3916 RepID=A0A1S3TEJ3_VIGRR|nr:blue copper protein [Vigna radiata var. radiata]
MASSIALVFSVCLVLNMVMPTLAATHTVGDTSGWAIGGDYSTWASGLKFRVGDSLVFNYGPGHTVDEVKESDYKSCSTGNSLSTDSSGATTITLKTAGTHYFICAAPGHCQGGMKLAVKVKAKKVSDSAAAPSPAKDSPPSDSDNTKDTPTTSTTTTSTTPTSTTPSTSTSSTTTATTSSAIPSSPIGVAVFIGCWISYLGLRLL